MRMDARRATKVVARTTKLRRARAASHLRSCAAERAVARRITVARASARLRGRTYRAPCFGEHDADAAFYRNPDGTAAATRSAKLGVRERQHERPVSQCFLRQLAPLPAPRSRESESGAPFRAVCFVARLVKGVWPFTAPRFAHPIPEGHRRNRVGLNQRFLKLLLACCRSHPR